MPLRLPLLETALIGSTPGQWRSEVGELSSALVDNGDQLQEVVESSLSQLALAAYSLAVAWDLPLGAVKVFHVVTLYELEADSTAEKVPVYLYIGSLTC
ncbi:unnamed protein product [Dibothriocephalus latus]|uniref:Uncharacterized protein n=1 Tax=Dibothriocephalus latus TaxID=60516 RepID=A0A3P7Q057_DIBLA|nr:unnamed protein product [Dibothriocephalus latus]